MPPKVKFTREEILVAAYELLRKKGKEALTARSLASALGTSTAPIFTAFESIDALTDAVRARAKETYDAYLHEGLLHPIPFKGTGLAHIRFAKDEPLLFRFLFIEAKDADQFIVALIVLFLYQIVNFVDFVLHSVITPSIHYKCYAPAERRLQLVVPSVQ